MPTPSLDPDPDAPPPERRGGPTRALPDEPWLTPRFLLVLTVQACFSLGWSTFLLAPKFFADRVGLSGGTILSLGSVASVGALLAVPFVGYALDRFGRRPFVAAGSVMVAVAALGFAFVERVGPLAVGLLLLEGVGFVFAWNASAAIAADLAPPAKLGRAIGVFGAANLSMNAVAPWIGEGLADAYGWHVPFLAASATCVAAVALSTALPRSAGRARPAHGATFRAMLQPNLVRTFAGAALFAVSFTAVFTLHAPFAIERGVREVGPFFAGFTATALVTRLALGGLVDRVGARRVSAVAMTAYASAPIALFVLGPTRLAVVGAILGACHGVLFPAVMALAVEESEASARGTAMTFVHGAFNLGSIGAGVVLGRAADHFGFGPALVCASIATLLGAAITARLGSAALAGAQVRPLRGAAREGVGDTAESAR